VIVAIGQLERLHSMINRNRITYIPYDGIFDFHKLSSCSWVLWVAAVQIGDDFHPQVILIRIDEPTTRTIRSTNNASRNVNSPRTFRDDQRTNSENESYDTLEE
jgi:hypothetical protein